MDRMKTGGSLEAIHYVMAAAPTVTKSSTAMNVTSRTFARKASLGFTLLEMLLAVALVGILAAMSVSSYTKYVSRAKVHSAISDIGKLKLKIEQYALNHNGMPPATLTDIGAQNLKDPWGNPYEYLNFSGVSGNGQKRKDHNLVPINTQYDLYSKGADGDSVGPLTSAKSLDDVIMANDGAYIGLASDY